VTITDPLPRAAAEYLTTAFHRVGVATDARARHVDNYYPQRSRRRSSTYDGVTPDAPASVILKKVANPERRMSHWIGRPV